MMVSGNLLVLAILLLPLVLWGSGESQAASPGITARTGKQDASTHMPTQSLQTTLLKRLGLQTRPESKPGLVVPQYLLDLYHFSVGEAAASFGEVRLPFLEERARTADTVRTFHHVGELKICKPYSQRHVGGVPGSLTRGQRFLGKEP